MGPIQIQIFLRDLLVSGTLTYIPSSPGTYWAEERDPVGCVNDTRTAVEATSLPVPTYAFISDTCSVDLQNYRMEFTTDTDSVAIDFGILSDLGGGNYEISNVPRGQNVSITLTNRTTLCDTTVVKIAPPCPCPTILEPTGDTLAIVCAGDLFSPIFVNVLPGETADWYDSPTGGILLWNDSTSYTPLALDTFYVEAQNLINGCTSPTRLAIIVEERPVPTLSQVGGGVRCAVDQLSYEIDIYSNSDTIIVDAGTVVHNMDSSYTIVNIPAGTNVNIVSTFFDTGCSSTILVSAPDCSCTADQPLVDNEDYCQGDVIPTFIATVSAGNTVDWYDVAFGGSPLAIDTLRYQPLSAGTYYAAGVEIATGCENPNRVEVVITENDLPTYTQDSVYCSLDLATYSVDIDAAPGLQLIATPWISNYNGGTSYTISGITAGDTLHFTLRNPTTGCQDAYSIDPPDCGCSVVDSPVGSSQSICQGEPIPQLSATVNANEVIDWYDMNVGGTLLASGNTFTPIAAGTFYAEARDTITSCISINRTAIAVLENTLPADPAANADVEICIGEAISDLSASSDAGTVIDWYTSAIGGTPIQIASTNYSATIAGTYYMEARDTVTGCISSGRDSTDLIINPLPSLTVDSVYCAMDSLTYEVALTSSEAINPSIGSVTPTGGNTYVVSGITLNADVTITATNFTTGCDTSIVIIGIDCTPAAMPVDPPVSQGDVDFCSNEAIPSITASVNAGETVDWYDMATGGTALLLGDTTFTPTIEGTYFAEARDTTTSSISSSRTSITITRLDLPTIMLVDTICDLGAMTYDLLITTDGMLTSADTGIVIDNGGGDYTITDIPAGYDIGLSLTSATACTMDTTLIAPICVEPCSISTLDTIYSTTIVSSADVCVADSSIDYRNITANDNGSQYTDPIVPCASFTLLSYKYSSHVNGASSGPYTLETWTIRGQTYGNITVADFNDLVDSLNVIDPDGEYINDAANGRITFTGDPDDYGILRVYDQTTGGRYNIDIETESVPNGVQLSLDLGSHLVILTDALSGCVDSVVVIVTQVPDCSLIDAPSSNDVLFCGGNLPGLMASAGGLRIDWYDVPFGGSPLLQDSEVFMPSQLGTYYAETVDENTGCTSSVRTEVEVIQAPEINVVVDSTVCSADNFTYDLYILTDGISIDSDGHSLTALGNGRYRVEDINSGFDANLTVSNGMGCTLDTTVMSPTCLAYCEIAVPDTLIATTDDPDEGVLCVELVAGKDYDDIDIIDNGNLFTGSIDSCVIGANGGMEFTLAPGIHNIIFRDRVNGCIDTMYLELRVTPVVSTFESVYAGESGCVPIDDPFGGVPIESFSDECADLNGTHVSGTFDPDAMCLDYTSISAGTDTFCIKMIDSLGNESIATITITVVLLQPDTVCLILPVNTDTIACADTLQLIGMRDTTELVDVDPMSPVMYDLDGAILLPCSIKLSP